jgi:hypothetical protein
MKMILYLAIALCFSFSSAAFTTVEDTTITKPDTTQVTKKSGTISVRCTLDSVRVILDTTYLGLTPIENFMVSKGIHILRFIHPENNIWLHPALIETVAINPSEHIEREVLFPSNCIITSDPFGAIVRHGDSILGTTPILLSTTSEKYLIRLLKNGFKEIETVLPLNLGKLHVDLERLSNTSSTTSSMTLMKGQSEVSVPIYIMAGATVISGATAAYFKIKADRFSTDYRQTNSNATLSKVRRLDLVSGISLAASEISLFLLSYLLFSQ